MSKIAITHDHFPYRGGGEYVAEELARTFEAPLYTSFINDDVAASDITTVDLFGDGLMGRIIRGNSGWRVFLRNIYYMLQWDSVEKLNEYDVIIQSGNHVGWYIPREGQTIIRYIHTPPRQIFDQFQEMDQNIFYKLYAHFMRLSLSQTINYPDQFIANSELVARRCEQYFGIPREEIKVVYPPTDMDKYSPKYKKDLPDCDVKDYYFVLSRLTPAKSVEEIVEVFNNLSDEYQLIIGGDGPEKEYLETISEDNIEFLGYVNEKRKRALLAGATAGVFAARNEDFGMVPIEFLASGTPVIGVNEGFTKYQIIDGDNGLLYDRGNLREVIKQFDERGVSWSNREIRNSAKRFSRERFRSKMQETVHEAVEDSTLGTSQL